MKVGVIGAGPCGLPVCKALEEQGLDYECLEAGERVGGVWDLGAGKGGAYRSLQTNTSTGSMMYSDFPFESDQKGHLDASELLEYFERYAKHFGLYPKIRFGSRVEKAKPTAEGGWRVEIHDGTIREYSALIVATGQYVKPRPARPAVPGTFDGEQLHVFDYLDPAEPVDCRGKRVVVVGLGSSAAEVAAELADPDHPTGGAEAVHVAARTGRWVINKVIDGKPIDAAAPHPATRLPGLIRALPDSVGIWMMRRGMKVAIQRAVNRSGRPESLGLPLPSIEPWAERPTMSLDFLPALEKGRIEVHPGIAQFDGKKVVFSDRSSIEADVIVWATGYELDFPFLSKDVLGCEAPDLALYQQIVHPERAGLFFVGCLRVACSMWPVAEQQGRWIAKLLNGGFTLPSSQTIRTRATGLARSLPVMCNFYVEQLRREAGGL